MRGWAHACGLQQSRNLIPNAPMNALAGHGLGGCRSATAKTLRVGVDGRMEGQVGGLGGWVGVWVMVQMIAVAEGNWEGKSIGKASQYF